jgi:hypothetical protein
MAAKARIIKAKLGFNIQTPDGTFLLNSWAIATALRKNQGGFYSPLFDKLSQLDDENDAFDETIVKMHLGGLGRAGAKSAAKAAVKATLDSALGYINDLAKANREHAAAIITGALMQVIKAGTINKQDFTVKRGHATGEVILTSLAAIIDGRRVEASYRWRYSLDGGITWTELPSTVVAKTVVKGMPIEQKVFFQKRVITVKGGTTAWCPKQSVFVE